MPDTGSHDQAQDFTPQQRRKAGVRILFVLCLLAIASVYFERMALSISSWWIKGPELAASLLLMWGALTLTFRLLRRKLKTGQFLISRSEASLKRVEISSTVGAGKPFGPQARYWVIPAILCAVPIALSIPFIALAALPYGDGLTMRLRITLAAIAALLLFLPFQFLFKTIRRRLKTGSFLPSQEEMAVARERYAQPKPLGRRLLLAGMICVVAVLATVAALGSHPILNETPSERWGFAALWWVIAGLWILRVFRSKTP